MLFLSYLLALFLSAYLFRSLASGLVAFSDRLFLKAMGMADAAQLLQRRPRAAAAWDFAQAALLGALYAAVLAGVRHGYVQQGGGPWLYSAVMLFWALPSGVGIKTNPGIVFAACFLGVLFNLWSWPWGSLLAVALLAPFLVAILKSRIFPPKPPSASASSVVIDVEKTQ